MGKVVAMYDVTGIQSYIFRTSKLKDAIGASAVVENIIEDALNYAVDKYAENNKGLTSDLKWCDEKGPLEYVDSDSNSETNSVDVKVYYIGGGNAYVEFSDEKIALEISKIMAKYTLDKTYSLQLATAWVPKTGNYKKDYKKLMDTMADVKAKMIVSKPVGAFPVMKTEIKTGYAVTANNAEAATDSGKAQGLSTESAIKQEAGNKVRSSLKLFEKQFESFISEKETDSLLAAVHIDGNNMGLRIRHLVENIEKYEQALNRMRCISFNINNSFKKTFEDLQNYFNKSAGRLDKFKRKAFKNSFVMKVITAGDDITYVCNAGIAIATVESFCKNISQKSMIDIPEDSDLNMKRTASGNKEVLFEEKSEDYKFSTCAGIAYFNSHFPFDIAYDVAEKCSESAKDRAKKLSDNGKIGNWFDFQFCRNIQTRDLKSTRKEEYVTGKGESLIRRPYFIPVEGFEKISAADYKEEFSYTKFCENMKNYVLDTNGNIPRSYVKELRNTYPLGSEQVEELYAFLKSRGRILPKSMYFDCKEKDKIVKVALLYDALEVADYFISLDMIETKEDRSNEQI